MSHDRARLSALVDGELDHDARDRVLAHLAQCDECRAVVETERRVKALLSGMPEASPGGDFLARLSNLGDPNAAPITPPAPAARVRRRPSRRGRAGGQLMRTAGQPPSVPGDFGGSQPAIAPPAAGGLGRAPAHLTDVPAADARPTGGSPVGSVALPLPGLQRSGRRHPPGRSFRPAATRPFGHPDFRPDFRPDSRRPGRFRSGGFGRRFTVGVAGAASLAGMALVTAFTVGGTTAPTTADIKVVPPIEQYTVQHADSVIDLPFADPGAATATIGDANLTGLLSTNR